MVKICFVIYPTHSISASIIHTYNTYKHLKQNYLNTTLILPDRSQEIKRSFKSLKPTYITQLFLRNIFRRFGRKFYFVRYVGYYFQETLYSFNAFFYLIRFLKKEDLIIYSTNFIVIFWFTIFAKFTKIKTVYEIHNLDKKNPFFKKYNFLEPFIKPFAIKNSSFLITLSATSKKEIIRRNLKNKNRISNIPIGSCLDIFKPLQMRKCRNILNIDQKGKIIIYSGITFSYRKLDFLLKTFLNTKKKNLRLILVGGHLYETTKLKKNITNDESKKIFFTGIIPPEKVALYLNASDILILHSTLHGKFSAPPQKLFEYMAVQKPIVSAKLPQLKEFLGSNAFYFKKNNIKSFKSAILKCLNNPKEAKRRASKLYQESKKYTYSNRVKKIIKICDFLEKTIFSD